MQGIYTHTQLFCPPYKDPLKDPSPGSVPGSNHRLSRKIIITITIRPNKSVLEIKDAPCSLHAHFGCRVHRFQHLCTQWVHAFFNILIPLCKEELTHGQTAGCMILAIHVHPVCAQYKTLISNPVKCMHQ